MPDKSRMTKPRLVAYVRKSRGKPWRARFELARQDGASRYRAALIAEALYGPSEFQRGVCAAAVERGDDFVDPPARGMHHRAALDHGRR